MSIEQEILQYTAGSLSTPTFNNDSSSHANLEPQGWKIGSDRNDLRELYSLTQYGMHYLSMQASVYRERKREREIKESRNRKDNKKKRVSYQSHFTQYSVYNKSFEKTRFYLKWIRFVGW